MGRKKSKVVDILAYGTEFYGSDQPEASAPAEEAEVKAPKKSKKAASSKAYESHSKFDKFKKGN